MDGPTLQDRIARGLGAGARAIGVPCVAYRPSGSTSPLASANGFLALSAAFNAQDPRFRTAGMAGEPVWYGVFDSAYLLAGDYLVEQGGGRTWFVGALPDLLPARCVLTNRVVSVTRPALVSTAGVNAYGGGAAAAPVLAGFPASLLHGGGGRGVGPGAIPADARTGGAVALLPPVGGIAFARGDLLADDLGRRYVAADVEQNDLGWRLDLRQAAS